MAFNAVDVMARSRKRDRDHAIIAWNLACSAYSIFFNILMLLCSAREFK